MYTEFIEAMAQSETAGHAAACWWMGALLSPVIEPEEANPEDPMSQLMTVDPNNHLPMSLEQLEQFSEQLADKIDRELEERTEVALEIDAPLIVSVALEPDELLQSCALDANLPRQLQWPFHIQMYVTPDRIHVGASYLPGGFETVWTGLNV